LAATVRWGIIGTGHIAHTFARGLQQSESGELVAVGSRTHRSARAFADRFGGVGAHDSYDDLLADPEVDAVYITTPHPMHAEWAIKAAEAGKHVLCEKPLTMNRAEAASVVQAAREHDVFLMEAFMYRCHPQTARLVQLIREGAIGRLSVIRAAHAFRTPPGAVPRLDRRELGGGAILDVGCYCLSMARLLAGAALGTNFAEPLEVQAVGHVSETGVDEWTIACLRFPQDIVAQLATSIRAPMDNTVCAFGSEGSIVVSNPWNPDHYGGQPTVSLRRGRHWRRREPEEIPAGAGKPLFAIEADTVAAHIPGRQAPAVTWADSLGNMAAMDEWRRRLGVTYEADERS
jgi:predicted dehydrogenase